MCHAKTEGILEPREGYYRTTCALKNPLYLVSRSEDDKVKVEVTSYLPISPHPKIKETNIVKQKQKESKKK